MSDSDEGEEMVNEVKIPLSLLTIKSSSSILFFSVCRDNRRGDDSSIGCNCSNKSKQLVIIRVAVLSMI